MIKSTYKESKKNTSYKKYCMIECLYEGMKVCIILYIYDILH